MGKFKDISGNKYGRWLVIKLDHMDAESFWQCECECGKIGIVRIGDLKSGKSLSCGCYQKEMASITNIGTNEYNLSGDYGVGYLENGDIFLFDLSDYELIKDYKWHISQNKYIKTFLRGTNNKKMLHLSRLIMGLAFDNNDINVLVDHINHNTLDNRKENLRFATKGQNNCNVSKRKDNTSGYTGVYLDKKLNKYYSKITIKRKQIYLGYFNNIEDAIQTRREAEIKYFGEFRYIGE